MAFSWKEFLELSIYLKECNDERVNKEDFLRSAISRAYFAAFCHARNYARDKEQFLPSYKAEDHNRLREHYRAKRRLPISNQLSDLRLWRNCCDYDDEVDNIDRLIQSAINRADNILRQLKN